jgi:hypothetical protein
VAVEFRAPHQPVQRPLADVYPFAGALRYLDAKPGQTGEPFLHHRWIDVYTSAVTQQLRLEDNLATRTEPGQWADRAAYYWAAMLHAHPYREGNGRSIRVWIEAWPTTPGTSWTGRAARPSATSISPSRRPTVTTNRCVPC